MISICCLSRSVNDAGGSRLLKLFSSITFFYLGWGWGGNKQQKDIWGNPNSFWFLVSALSTDSFTLCESDSLINLRVGEKFLSAFRFVVGLKISHWTIWHFSYLNIYEWAKWTPPLRVTFVLKKKNALNPNTSGSGDTLMTSYSHNLTNKNVAIHVKFPLTQTLTCMIPHLC